MTPQCSFVRNLWKTESCRAAKTSCREKNSPSRVLMKDSPVIHTSVRVVRGIVYALAAPRGDSIASAIRTRCEPFFDHKVQSGDQLGGAGTLLWKYRIGNTQFEALPHSSILYRCVSGRFCGSSFLRAPRLPDRHHLCIVIFLAQCPSPSLRPRHPCATSVAVSASALLSSLKPSVDSRLQSVLGQRPLDTTVRHGCAHIGSSCRRTSS